MDFLTVGGMGLASQIALGIDLSTSDRDVWVLDGDGALLMHLGATAVIAEHATSHFKHIVLNNHVHDSVGGQPTPTERVSVPDLARAAGYRSAARARTEPEIRAALSELAANDGPALLEIPVRAGARSDLGRPKSTPKENKHALMSRLAQP
jgi:phosphonopyruvate decarboxylase